MKRTYAVLSIFNAVKKLVNTLIPQSVTLTNYISPYTHMTHAWWRITNTWNFISGCDIIYMYLIFKVVTIIKGAL